jgi:hypothetical protein
MTSSTGKRSGCSRSHPDPRFEHGTEARKRKTPTEGMQRAGTTLCNLSVLPCSTQGWWLLPGKLRVRQSRLPLPPSGLRNEPREWQVHSESTETIARFDTGANDSLILVAETASSPHRLTTHVQRTGGGRPCARP